MLVDEFMWLLVDAFPLRPTVDIHATGFRFTQGRQPVVEFDYTRKREELHINVAETAIYQGICHVIKDKTDFYLPPLAKRNTELWLNLDELPIPIKWTTRSLAKKFLKQEAVANQTEAHGCYYQGTMFRNYAGHPIAWWDNNTAYLDLAVSSLLTRNLDLILPYLLTGDTQYDTPTNKLLVVAGQKVELDTDMLWEVI